MNCHPSSYFQTRLGSFEVWTWVLCYGIHLLQYPCHSPQPSTDLGGPMVLPWHRVIESLYSKASDTELFLRAT